MMSEADLERRRQKAAQMVLESEMVTSGLEEDAAEAVLNWALAQADSYALSSEEMRDEQADTWIAQGVGKVHRLMSLVNDLVEEYDYMGPLEMVERLTHLLAGAMEGQVREGAD